MPKKKQKRPARPFAKNVAKETTEWDWRFRERAKQDGRAFGNAALYATPQEIESLVRETGQNSLDAVEMSTGERQVVMRYRLIELPSDSKRRGHFLEAIGWDNGLKPHLEAVANSASKSTNTAARVRASLKELSSPGSTLWLLAVEDYGTRGLEGAEFDPNMPYCALVRDSENSNKTSEGAGGSFGLGSKTLWACSDLLTVLFASEPHSERGKTRIIGKADLGFHELKDGAEHGYVGHGHFGRPFEVDAAESVWLSDHEQPLIKKLCLNRQSPVSTVPSTGTTALIVGFADPKADEQNAKDILSAIEKAIAINFWPAIARGTLRVFVRHERADEYDVRDEEVLPEKYVPSFVEAFRKHEAGDLVTSLEQSGDVVSIPVQHTVPATKDYANHGTGHASISAEARLILRLSDNSGSDQELADHIALVRGRAMVVRYLQKRNITLGARPFHGILATGTLVSIGGHQGYAEAFLRAAEPPAHNDWSISTSVRSRYSWGAGAKIRELFDEMGRLLRDYIGSRQESGDEVPEVLRDILRITDTGKAKQAVYKLSAPEIDIDGDTMKMKAEVECPDSDGHSIKPAVTFASESGKGFEMTWTSLAAENFVIESNQIYVPNGRRRFEMVGTLKSTIRGIDLMRCAYQISIKGNRYLGDK